MFQDNVSAEVSFHMARPATVVSNNSNNSNNSGGSVAGSPANTGEASTTATSAANTGGGMNLEWTSLVDTATKAIQDTGPDTAEAAPSVAAVAAPAAAADADVEAGDEKSALLDRVSRLEAELRAEREERAGLQQRVEHLQV